jgi:hypothetical protein
MEEDNSWGFLTVQAGQRPNERWARMQIRENSRDVLCEIEVRDLGICQMMS